MEEKPIYLIFLQQFSFLSQWSMNTNRKRQTITQQAIIAFLVDFR